MKLSGMKGKERRKKGVNLTVYVCFWIVALAMGETLLVCGEAQILALCRIPHNMPVLSLARGHVMLGYGGREGSGG